MPDTEKNSGFPVLNSIYYPASLRVAGVFGAGHPGTAAFYASPACPPVLIRL